MAAHGFMMKKRLLTLSMMSVWGILPPVHAQETFEEVEFNASFLRSEVDISRFSRRNPVEPGVHQVDLYVNNQWRGRHGIAFERVAHDELIARPCFDLETLALLNLNQDRLSAQVLASLEAEKQCLELGQIIDGGKAEFDSSALSLHVSVPQIFLQRRSSNYVDPSQWNEGISAFSLQYDYNAYHSRLSGYRGQSNQYLGLRSGANWDAWRFRHRGSFQWNNEGGNVHYQNSSAYMERAIVDWKSRLMLGEANTDGQVFNTLGFRGLQLSSDDRMYPDSERGFAPEIRGIANSNALVSISQAGSIIYETTVPPGAFVIDDLFPTGRGGDLLVTIREADGSERSFTVTYSHVPELLRPGITRYSLMAGQFQNNQIKDAPSIAMGTIRHGFSNLFTGYGGAIAAEGYSSASAGLALNTYLGAFSVDMTHAYTELPGQANQQGSNLRFSYAKILPQTNTNLTTTISRSSGTGYFETQDALVLRDEIKRGTTLTLSDFWHQKNRVTVSASQTLPGGYGSFAFNSSYMNYWDNRRSNIEYQFNYSNNYKRISYSFAAQRARRVFEQSWENQFMFFLSIPLGEGRYSPNWRTGITRQSDRTTYNNSLGGSFGRDSQFGYSVFTNTTDPQGGSSTTSYGGNLSWNAPYATMGASMSSGRDYSQYSMSMSGAMVGYSNGIVFAPYVGETIAVVEVPGAYEAQVSGYRNLKLNGQGKAVVPYLSPYRSNTVEIDPRGMSTDIELKVSSQNVVPTAGAVSLLQFATDVGYSLLLSGKKANGEPLPFGAVVLDSEGQNIGYIAQGSQAIVRVRELEGRLYVQWDKSEQGQCAIDYRVDAKSVVSPAGFRQLEVVCGQLI